MVALTQRRCLRHENREAVACCPGCGEFFCRECVTEHEDRVICAACLEKLLIPAAKPLQQRRWPWRILAGVAGWVFVIVFYYGMGRALLKTPSAFHEGSIWKESWFEETPDPTPGGKP